MLPQLEQIKQFTAVQPEQCFVDRGYRGHEVKDTKVFISGQKRGVTRSIKKALKRRSAIEPEIGHMKNDGRLDRCYLKGAVGDAINVVMVVAGHNLRKILNKFFYPEWEKTLLESGDKKRRRQGVMSPGELMTILINFHQSHYKDFKSYYLCHVHQHLRKEFPNLLSYSRFL